MNWIKKHILEIVSFLIIFISIIFLWNWVQEEPGKTIYENALSNIPFLEFCNKIYKMACDISGDTYTKMIPENSSIILDILKLLISTLVIMFARRLIFTKIPVVSDFLTRMPNAVFEANIQKEANATGAISISEGLKNKLMAREREDYLDTVTYKLKAGMVDVIITVVTLLFTTFVFEKYKDDILSFLSTKTGSLIGIISIVAIFFLYCLLFNLIYQKTFSFAIIKTLVFNVFPSTVSTLISGVLYYCCHMFMVENRNVWMFLLFWIFLFLWCGIKDPIEKELRIIATGYSPYYNFKFATFIAASYIYASYLIFAQFYSNDIDVLMQNQFMQMFCNIKALPFYEYILSGTKIIDKINLSDMVFTLELIKLCYFAFTVSLISGLLKNMKAEFSTRGFAIWTLKITIEIGLVFGVYSILLYLTNSDVHKMLIALFAYAVIAICINIFSAKKLVTSNLSFAPTNILLEAILIVAGELFLIYVAESIANENFLYLSITYNPNGTVDDMLTNEFIIRLIILFVAMIAWYVLEVLDFGIKNKKS